MMRRAGLTGLLLTTMLAALAAAQSSSLLHSSGGRPTARPVAPAQLAGLSDDGGTGAFSVVLPPDAVRPMTRAIERTSLIAVPTVPPRKFRVHDLITIIVRQQKRYEADAQYDAEKKWKLEGGLREWFRFYPRGRLGSDQLSNGDPTFKFDFHHRYETDGQNDRQDKFETRVTATVIDVKPNGSLVLEAKSYEQHDDEEIEITLTGLCRGEDVTPANSVLSTQLADLVLIEKNVGALRDATSRGWAARILDLVKPF